MNVGFQMVREAVELDAMDVAEIDDLVLDFSANTHPGETIASAEVTVEVARGKPDAGVASMAAGGHVIGVVDDSDVFVPDPAGLVVMQRVDANGRIGRNVYCLRCVVTLNSGRQLALACHIPVRKL